MATAGSKAALFLCRPAFGFDLFAVESRFVGCVRPSMAWVTLQEGSQLGERVFRAAGRDGGTHQDGRSALGSGVFAVERSGRSNAMVHQPKRLPGKAFQLVDTL
jgi:hypothetical protein